MAMSSLSSACDFMMGFGKPQLHAEFEIASPSRCRNIAGEPQNLGALLAQAHPHFFFWV